MVFVWSFWPRPRGDQSQGPTKEITWTKSTARSLSWFLLGSGTTRAPTTLQTPHKKTSPCFHGSQILELPHNSNLKIKMCSFYYYFFQLSKMRLCSIGNFVPRCRPWHKASLVIKNFYNKLHFIAGGLDDRPCWYISAHFSLSNTLQVNGVCLLAKVSENNHIGYIGFG
jgi:hypothetical protein